MLKTPLPTQCQLPMIGWGVGVSVDVIFVRFYCVLIPHKLLIFMKLCRPTCECGIGNCTIIKLSPSFHYCIWMKSLSLYHVCLTIEAHDVNKRMEICLTYIDIEINQVHAQIFIKHSIEHYKNSLHKKEQPRHWAITRLYPKLEVKQIWNFTIIICHSQYILLVMFLFYTLSQHGREIYFAYKTKM